MAVSAALSCKSGYHISLQVVAVAVLPRALFGGGGGGGGKWWERLLLPPYHPLEEFYASPSLICTHYYMYCRCRYFHAA